MKTCNCNRPCMCIQGDSWQRGYYGFHPHFQPAIYTHPSSWPPGHLNPNQWPSGGFSAPTFTVPPVNANDIIHETIKSSTVSLFECYDLPSTSTVGELIRKFAEPEGLNEQIQKLLSDRLRIRIDFIFKACDRVETQYAYQCRHVITTPVTVFDACPFDIEKDSDLGDLNKLCLLYQLLISIQESQKLAANIDLLKQTLTVTT